MDRCTDSTWAVLLRLLHYHLGYPSQAVALALGLSSLVPDEFFVDFVMLT